MSNGFYGRDIFDAQTIVAQILIMQALFYLLLGLACLLVDTVFGVPISLDQMLSSKAFNNMSARLAWATIFSLALSACFNVLALRVVSSWLGKPVPRCHLSVACFFCAV
jgi:uncharacterized membrane protein